ncbi:MAG: FAD-dependent oxidoreductase [Verrucomicrobia bacterium]|nr:FAD-dependent oxidoreductase [Verrucomicrobiota bacterium]
MDEDKSLNEFLKAVEDLGISYDMAPNPQETSVFTGAASEPLDFKTYLKDVPCQDACPSKTNVPAYIEAIAKGDPDKAYLINQEDNVFAGVLGRVCSRPCEDACRHNWTGTSGPVHICHLKRSASDYKENAPKPLPGWFEDTGKKVAVIGGGPAGLTAARELKRYGHSVTIFERDSMLGGMMIQGIPVFRLPREAVEAEVNAIIESGIDVKYNTSVDATTMPQLIDEYDSVLVAVGTVHPSNLKLPGLPGDGHTIPGLKFMYDYNMGEIGDMQGQNVIIVGGGFTAVDCGRSCARAAKRLVGAEGTVTIMYRRTEAQMSADPDEINQMRLEEIVVETLMNPLSARTEDGKLVAVTFQRNALDDTQSDGGKPRIHAIEGTEEEYPCNLLIMAIGQTREVNILPEGVQQKEGHHTTLENVFVAGDFNYGSFDVITAVNDGKEVANKIDTLLMGEERRKTHIAITMTDTNGETGRVRDHDIQFPVQMPKLPLFERDGIAEVELGHTEDGTQIHATRCYFCNYKFEINQDACIHCDWCIAVAPRDCINRVSRLFHDEDGAVTSSLESNLVEETTYIWIDSNECIRCGKCLRICPTGAITMRKMEMCGCSTSELKEKQKANVPYGEVKYDKY